MAAIKASLRSAPDCPASGNRDAPARQVMHQLLAEGAALRHNAVAMDLLNQKFLWASVIWGAIAGGYLVYGFRQKDATCLAGGGLMMVVACFVPALPMSLICIVTMAVVYWLIKQGY